MTLIRPTICILFCSLLWCAIGCDSDMPGAASNGDGTITDWSDHGGVEDWYADITSEVGLDFDHETGATGELHLPEIMASGAALFDFDLDGDLDIYLTNGADGLTRTVPRAELQTFSPASEGPTNRLYRQEDNGSFVDVSGESGLDDPSYGMGIAIGDIDNDGDPDVYLTNFGLDKLYLNLGDGTFKDVTEAAGIDVTGWSCSAAFFDYDRDGWLDLFVTRYVDYNPQHECSGFSGKADYCGPKAYPPVHDCLLHNNGDGSFTDVTDTAGISAAAAAGLGVNCGDLSGDGWPDIYVANDGYANHLWINQHDGTFVDSALVGGVALNWQGAAEAGMGVVTADLDNDLDLDLFMTHLHRETNTFYRNEGDGHSFVDGTAPSGLGPTSVAFTGFGTAALDVELDGDLDLPVVNGRVLLGEPVDGVQLDEPWNYYAEPNLFYLNDGQGNFQSSERMPSFCNPIEISRGLAMGDIDSDGDLDLLISNVQGPARLYRNVAERKGYWLIIEAVEPQTRRHAIGAVVTVNCADRRLMRTVTRAVGYLSSSQPAAHFGLGSATAVDSINVRWPDGTIEVFDGGPVDRTIRLVRGEGRIQP